MKTPPFSHKRMREIAIATKIRRAITMASKKYPNKDFKAQHPDWVRDAQNKNFTNLTKIIKDEVQKKQQRALDRRDKIAGKD